MLFPARSRGGHEDTPTASSFASFGLTWTYTRVQIASDMEKRQRRSYGTLGEPDSDTDTDSEDSDSSVNAKKLPSIAPPAPPTPVPSAPVPVPPRSVSWKKGSIIYGLDLAADPFPTKPSFLLQVLLLVLIGVRPKHLAHRVSSSPET